MKRQEMMIQRKFTEFCLQLSWHNHLLSNILIFMKKCFKGTLMQIWKSANVVVFIRKKYVEDFTLKHFLLFKICAREICEKFIYKH